MVDRMSELFGYENTDRLLPKRSSMKRSISRMSNSKIDIVYSDNINVLTKELLKTTLTNQKILSSILKQQLEEADEGAYSVRSGIVTTTSFVTIECVRNIGHPVKGYNIKNNGPNPIYIAHNASMDGIDPELIDVTTSETRFELLGPNLSMAVTYNRKKIRNVSILSSVGNSSYIIKLLW